VPVRTIRTSFWLAVATLFTVVAVWGQAPKQDWKDRAEYDIATSVEKTTDNAKKIELLNIWKQKYPTTDFQMTRLQHYLLAYVGLKQFDKVVETGNEALAIDPKNLQALYLMTASGMSLPKPTPGQLSLVEKAARTLTTDLDALKPANAVEAEWNKSKPDILTLGHTTLGWIAMSRKENEAAEKEFTESLKVNPNNGQVSYWLGSVILAQRNPDTQAAALYHIARAAAYTGPGAYAGAKQAAEYLTKAYTSFHGSTEGLDDLRKIAAAQAFPPEGFKIASKGELDLLKEEEFKKANPMLALWQTVKKELTGPNGATYFDGGVKGALLPGGAGGVKRFRAKLVAAKPPKNPKELLLSLDDPTGDITLVILDEPLVGSAPVGTELEFEGVPTAYAASPYMLTFEVDKETQLSGWPAPAPPASKKKAPPKKK
jgi:tetratricopeptide (TPR) repeat protein